MKKLTIIITSLVIVALMNACSDSSSPEGMTEVSFKGELTTNTVSNTVLGSNSILESEIDKIEITRVRILIKELKVTINNDDNGLDDNKYKSGPFVVDALYPLSPDFAVSFLPEGEINKIKFEFHRFSSSELSLYINDAVFIDFATQNRYSVIIEGKIYENSEDIGKDFIYNSDMTANLSLNLEKMAKLEKNKPAIMTFVADPSVIFISNGKIVDPRDPKNENILDNNIKTALKLKFALK